MRKNISSQSVSAQLLSATDGSEVTTGTTTVEVTIDSGTQTTGVGTVSHEGSGLWSYLPTQAETNGDHIVFTFKNVDAMTTSIQVYTISFDPHNITSLGLTNLDATISSRSDFDASSDVVANVALVDTTTTNTDMRGTNNALLAASYLAPDNSSISSILADTNDLQTNQGNWLTATGFATVNPDNASIAAILTDTGTTIPNQISSLNDFNPSTDTVANVTLVGTTTTITNGVTVSTNNDKTGYSLSQTFPTNFSSLDIDVSGNVNSFVQGYLSTAITESTSGNISDNLSVFFDNGDTTTSKVVDDVGTAVSGGGEFTTTEKNQLRYRLGLDGTAVEPTANPDLSQKSDISSLNNFNPSTDTVANVTLVDTTTTNTDMRGTDNSLLASNYVQAPTVNSIVDGVWDEPQASYTTVGTFGYYLDDQVSSSSGGGGSGATAAEVWAYGNRELTSGDNIVLAKGTGIIGFNDIAATDIVSNGAIDTTSGAIDNVTLVDTTSVNTDMRGTEDALLASNYTSPDNSSITSILADTNELQNNQGNWLTATGFNTVAPDNASISAILANTSTTIPNQISGLNDISVVDILTTQMTESYAADGVAPTLAQGIFNIQQNLGDFSYSGVTQTVKGLDGVTAVMTYTLDDAVNSTSKTRAS